MLFFLFGVSVINITIISIVLLSIVITNLSVCAGYKLTPASAQKRFPLLMPTLDGLTKYAHLIDVDYFADLLQVSHSPPSLHAHTHQLEQMLVVQGCICHCLRQHCFGSSIAALTHQHEPACTSTIG